MMYPGEGEAITITDWIGALAGGICNSKWVYAKTQIDRLNNNWLVAKCGHGFTVKVNYALNDFDGLIKEEHKEYLEIICNHRDSLSKHQLSTF